MKRLKIKSKTLLTPVEIEKRLTNGAKYVIALIEKQTLPTQNGRKKWIR